MGTVFHAEIDTLSTICRRCDTPFEISFSGDSENPEHKIGQSCNCPGGPSAESIKFAKEALIFQAKTNPQGRIDLLKERGIK